MKILIADDERIEREALAYMLRKLYGENHTIIEARNGADAVQVYTEESPQVVLMDIQMPVLDGLEACRKIRQLSEEVTIIVITAYSRFDYAKEAISCQVREYLVKPYSMQALKQVMDPIMATADETLWNKTVYASAENGTAKELQNKVQNEIHGIHTSENQLVTEIKAYIAEHYAEDISLPILEEQLGKSRFVISRTFNESEKESIREYINRVRISHAIGLMREGKNISEAGYEVGFHEPAHFSKVFRKIVGMSPSAYLSIDQKG